MDNEKKYNEALNWMRKVYPTLKGADKEDAEHFFPELLDTLEESDRPEPYNPVYDEAYLNEKIAKATKSWKGVDVDAMLAECRGYEGNSEKPNNHLEGLDEAAWNYASKECEIEAFKAGAEWDRSQGVTVEGEIMVNGFYPYQQKVVAEIPNNPFEFGDKVIVQIRKK